jgi:hypothetical protein
MSIKVSVCISLEHVFGSDTETPSACSHKFGLYLYFGINGPTVLHTTTGTRVMAQIGPGMYCVSHHSLKLAVNLVLDIWGSQCIHCQPLERVIHNLTCNNKVINC